MIIGTNWFFGYSHCTLAKDRYVRENVADRHKIADIIEVYAKTGVDTIIGLITMPVLAKAIQEGQDRTGRKIIVVSTPSLPVTPRTPFDGFDLGEVARILDEEAAGETAICMPHTSTTDRMVDRCTRELRQMDAVVKLIRERGMIPSLEYPPSTQWGS